MTREEIFDGVVRVAREQLGIEREIAPDERLVEGLGLDSIRLLTLAAEVENRFRIALEPEDEARIATVADLVDAVAAKLASGSGPGAHEPEAVLE